MDHLRSGVRSSLASSVLWPVVVTLVAAATCGLGMWGLGELVHLEPYTVEVSLLVPRLDVSRLARMIVLVQLIVGAAVVATVLARGMRRSR